MLLAVFLTKVDNQKENFIRIYTYLQKLRAGDFVRIVSILEEKFCHFWNNISIYFICLF